MQNFDRVCTLCSHSGVRVCVDQAVRALRGDRPRNFHVAHEGVNTPSLLVRDTLDYTLVLALVTLTTSQGHMRGKPRGYAFVEYETREEAEKAREGIDQMMVLFLPLSIVPTVRRLLILLIVLSILMLPILQPNSPTVPYSFY